MSWTSLLADIDPDRLEMLRSGFAEPRSAPTYLVLWVLVAALALVLLLVLASRRRTRRPQRSSTDFLALLAEAAELNAAELEDLRTVAARGRMAHPGCLLLSPANMAHGLQAAERWREDPPLRARLNALSEQVYGVPLANPAPEPS